MSQLICDIKIPRNRSIITNFTKNSLQTETKNIYPVSGRGLRRSIYLEIPHDYIVHQDQHIKIKKIYTCFIFHFEKRSPNHIIKHLSLSPTLTWSLFTKCNTIYHRFIYNLPFFVGSVRYTLNLLIFKNKNHSSQNQLLSLLLL